jgi:hypothetical protein
MKGIQGILIAIGLGLAGTILSWLYLERLAGREAKVAFIGVKANSAINVGDVIRAEHLTPIEIPRSRVGNLETVAPLWEYHSTVIGLPSTRTFQGGEIVLQQDLRSPGMRDLNDKLGKNEVAVWLPVDPRTFNAARVNPDDEVSFVVPRAGLPTSPTPADATEVQEFGGASEIIGPFRILEIGSRTGRTEVYRATGGRTANEATITVVAKLIGGQIDPQTGEYRGGALEPVAERILEVIRQTKSQGLQVILHPKRKAGE